MEYNFIQPIQIYVRTSNEYLADELGAVAFEVLLVS
jgi:hypothetical protein